MSVLTALAFSVALSTATGLGAFERVPEIKEFVIKRSRINIILENHGDWLLIDISTPKFPDATMAVDTDVFNSHKGGRISANKNPRHRYIRARFRESLGGIVKSKYFHHSVITLRDGLEVDHIKHGTLSYIDNRALNLRLVTARQNQLNRAVTVNSKSGVKGVYRNGGMWRADASLNGKTIHLGSFAELDDAANAMEMYYAQS